MFSHGWPLCSDAWQVKLKLFADAGYRAIAHDRRGHGRSIKTNTGNDMETYARDLADLIATLDLRDVIVIGHSTGGGEVSNARRRTARTESRRSSPPARYHRSWSSPTRTPKARQSKPSIRSVKGC